MIIIGFILILLGLFTLHPGLGMIASGLLFLYWGVNSDDKAPSKKNRQP
jgi:predicted cobalt transporter CbtA